MNVSNVKYLVTLEGNTYTYEVADAVIGTYTRSGSSYQIILDGFGAGSFVTYSASDITYTYDADTNTVVVTKGSDTFTFVVQDDNSLKCTATTYSYYCAVDSIWA